MTPSLSEVLRADATPGKPPSSSHAALFLCCSQWGAISGGRCAWAAGNTKAARGGRVAATERGGTGGRAAARRCGRWRLCRPGAPLPWLRGNRSEHDHRAGAGWGARGRQGGRAKIGLRTSLTSLMSIRLTPKGPTGSALPPADASGRSTSSLGRGPSFAPSSAPSRLLPLAIGRCVGWPIPRR